MFSIEHTMHLALYRTFISIGSSSAPCYQGDLMSQSRPSPPSHPAPGTPLHALSLARKDLGRRPGWVPGLQQPGGVGWSGVGVPQSFPGKSQDLVSGYSEALAQFWQPELFLLQGEI